MTKKQAPVSTQDALLKFRFAVDEILHRSGRTPLPVLAAQLLDAETEVVVALTPEWQRTAVISMLRKSRADLRRQEIDTNYLFPEFERQYGGLPKRLTIANGKRVTRDKATYKEARQYLAVVLHNQRNSPRAVQAKQMVELLGRHAIQYPGIEWAQVVIIEGKKLSKTTTRKS